MSSKFKIIENAFIIETNWENMALDGSPGHGIVTWMLRENGDTIEQTFSVDDLTEIEIIITAQIEKYGYKKPEGPMIYTVEKGADLL